MVSHTTRLVCYAIPPMPGDSARPALLTAVPIYLSIWGGRAEQSGDHRSGLGPALPRLWHGVVRAGAAVHLSADRCGGARAEEQGDADEEDDRMIFFPLPSPPRVRCLFRSTRVSV
eukprot:scaffold84199_cov57-Phaeocystis_antarctica.AAC.1